VSTSHDSNSHHLNSHDTREHSTSHDTLEHSTSDDTQQCNSHATSHLPRTVAASTSASRRGEEGESSASVTYGVYGGGDATNEVYAEGDATNGVHGEGTATNGVYGEGNTGVNIRGGSWRWRFRYDVSLLQLERQYFWNFIGNALASQVRLDMLRTIEAHWLFFEDGVVSLCVCMCTFFGSWRELEEFARFVQGL